MACAAPKKAATRVADRSNQQHDRVIIDRTINRFASVSQLFEFAVGATCRPLLIAVLRVVLTAVRLNGPSVPGKLRDRTSSEAKTRVAAPELPPLSSQNQQSLIFHLAPQRTSSPLVLSGLLPQSFPWPLCHRLWARSGLSPVMAACPSYRG